MKKYNTMNKNGQLVNSYKTVCADGDYCVCHTSSLKLCSVCVDAGCKKRYDR